MRHRHPGSVRYRTRRGNIRYRKKPLHKVTVKGKRYNIYKSNRKNKEYMVDVDGKTVHFAEPTMPEHQGTKRGDSYCSRSYGIGRRDNTLNDLNSPNTWSRKLWSCRGKKSISRRKWV